MDNKLNYYKLKNISTGYRITNLQSYNGQLPTDKYFRPTSQWRILINSILQPQNHGKLWNKFRNFVSFQVVKIPQLQKVLMQILDKIASGYVARYETKLSINVPYGIKKIIATQYLVVEISIFKDVYFLEDCESFFEPYRASPRGRNISWRNIYIKDVQVDQLLGSLSE